ncbi:ABC transporter permease [Roseovarius nanhaiticus]|uniref:Peptide/nickel transport system permease protein n=1 Tax=Roseovarius nanhaiticus TaxID=573024 RepID=A0A1N7HN95_9RHOB|nr:ABC transporter permease [Roseovarius nanhaiticus]SEL36626.1 peptide/nickel transport system permease protein [Roseovarius nanhaiticus]SIS26241.1 peptide/nickel transport system permease protein [Roseovarius nanhaiticus]
MSTATLPRWAPMRRFIKGAPLATIGLIVLILLILAAIFAPWLAIHDPYDLSTFSILDARLAPGEASFSGSAPPLGTDDQGRDLYSAILYGLRISLMVAAVSGFFAFVIGTALGLLAGYYGGWTDRIVMRVVDIQLSIPAILVALVLLAILGRAVENTIIALVTVQWVYFARTVRASVLSERHKEYVQAGRLMGYSSTRLLLRHILPNCMGPLSVVATIEFAHAITLEATLSFLGVGLPITEPSLGRLVSNGFSYLLNGEWWISLLPGCALLILIFSINLVGDRLRDASGPRHGFA